MGKKLKKILAGVALVPCMLLTTACFDTPPEDPIDPNAPLTTAEQNTAYSSLRTLVSEKKYFNSNVTSKAYKVNTNTSNVMDVDWEGTGLTGDNLTALQTMVEGLDDSSEKYQSIDSVGYTSVGEGYSVHKSKKDNEAEYSVDQKEFVKKEGNDFRLYQYAVEKVGEGESVEIYEDKYIFNVDEHYAPETFGINFIEENFSDIFEKLVENETFADFKADINDFALDSIAENSEGIDLSAIEGIEDKITGGVSITLTDGVYELKASVNINDVTMPSSPMMPINMTFDAETEMSIKFDSDSIDALDMTADIDIDASVGLAMMNGAIDGVTFDSDDKLNMTMDIDMGIGIDTNVAFDNAVLSESTEGYKGTGVNNTVENITSKVCFEFPQTGGRRQWQSEGESNTDLLADEDFYFDYCEHIEVEGIYKDKEFTQKLDANAKYPSYNTTYYVKLRAKDGYTGIFYVENPGAVTEEAGYLETDTNLYVIMDRVSNAYISKVTVNGVAVEGWKYGIPVEQGEIYLIIVEYQDHEPVACNITFECPQFPGLKFEEEHEFDEGYVDQSSVLTKMNNMGVEVEGLYGDKQMTKKILTRERYLHIDTTYYVKLKTTQENEAVIYVNQKNLEEEGSLDWFQSQSTASKFVIPDNSSKVDVCKVVVNGIEVENWQQGIDVEPNKFYAIDIWYETVIKFACPQLGDKSNDLSYDGIGVFNVNKLTELDVMNYFRNANDKYEIEGIYKDKDFTQRLDVNAKVPEFNTTYYVKLKSTETNTATIYKSDYAADEWEETYFTTYANAIYQIYKITNTREIVSVKVNGVEVENWEDGIAIEHGKFYRIQVFYGEDPNAD